MPPRRNEEIQENLSAQNRNGEDIISSLPDTLLQLVLNFVDLKLAVQTSVLSRRWRNVWTSLGILTFNTDQFNSPMMFLNFVDQVFILRDNSTISVFNLLCYYRDPEIIRRRNAWIIAVIQHRVQHMHLRTWGESGDVVRLPSCLFACDSLMTMALTFDGNRRRASVTLPDSMRLPELKYLLLFTLVFDDERLTNDLFLSCPKLERLYLVNVEFRVNVDILSHTLLGLNVNNHTRDYSDCRWIDSTFRLNAPNLKVLVCKDFMFRDYILENLNSLSRADVDMKVEQGFQQGFESYGAYLERKELYGQRMMRFLRALHKVENLKLSAWFLEVISECPDLCCKVLSGSPGLFCQPTQFCSLKYLKLETWLSRDNIRAITYLLKNSPILESLSLEISKIKLGSLNIGENPEAWFRCWLDKLVLVEIQGAEGCVNELLFLEILLKNAKVLKKLVVYISKEDSANREEHRREFTEDLLTFQKASSDIEILVF